MRPASRCLPSCSRRAPGGRGGGSSPPASARGSPGSAAPSGASWRPRRRASRASSERGAGGTASWTRCSSHLAAGATFAAGLGHFVYHAGADAVLVDGHVLLTGLPAETRHFLLAFSGLPDWRRGIPELLYSAAMWTGIVLLVALLARRARRGPPPAALLRSASCSRSWRRRRSPMARAAPCSTARPRSSASPRSPSACGAATARRPRRWRRAAFSGSSSRIAGCFTSATRPTSARRSSSPSSAPPVCSSSRSAGGRRRRSAGDWPPRCGGPRPRSSCSPSPAGSGSTPRSKPFPSRGPPACSRRARRSRASSSSSGAAVRAGTPEGDGLAVFPEGEVLNFLSIRPNPVRHMLYLPGYLTAQNEPAVLAELVARPARGHRALAEAGERVRPRPLRRGLRPADPPVDRRELPAGAVPRRRGAPGARTPRFVIGFLR